MPIFGDAATASIRVAAAEGRLERDDFRCNFAVQP